MTMLDHALAWASRGFRVFPLRENSKVPLRDGWTETASSDPAQIKQWWCDPLTGIIRDFNVGVLTSGLALVDADIKWGKAGVINYLEYGGEPNTLTVRTPSGGYHYYHTAPHEVANSQGDSGGIAPGVDVRGWHGYVLAPGSVIDGKEYALVNDAPVAPLPAELLARMRRPEDRTERTAMPAIEGVDDPAAIASATGYLLSALPAISGMGGNTRTYQTAVQVRDRGASEAVCFELMLEHFNERCEPPWTPDELRGVVANAYAYAQNAEGAKHPERDFGDLDMSKMPAPPVSPVLPQRPAVLTEVHQPPIDPWEPLTPPSSFPLHALPPVLRDFVEDRARMLGADPAAIAWAAIVACSAALDGSNRLRMKQHDKGWLVPPALWVALVGKSSTKKTPVIDATWAPLIRKQYVEATHHADALALWNSLPEERKAGTPPKLPPRYVSHDATPEALQIILGQQDRGIGVLKDELTGLVGAFGKYSAGKGGGAAERASYLQGYNGNSFTPDRVTRAALPIKNWLFAIIGGIQPERLAQLTDLTDDGLWQRFIPIVVRPGTTGLDEPSGEAVDAYSKLIETLTAYPGGARVHLSPEARAVRARVEAELAKIEADEPLGAPFATFCGKLPGVWGRLALTLHYVAGMGAAGDVSEATAEAARTLMLKSVLPNAFAVYAAMSRGDGADAEATRAIAGYILAKRKTRVLSSELMRDVWICRGKPLPVIQKMVQTLDGGGWLATEIPNARNPKAWAVNPEVHRIFADRAAEETARRDAAHQRIAGSVNFTLTRALGTRGDENHDVSRSCV